MLQLCMGRGGVWRESGRGGGGGWDCGYTVEYNINSIANNT